MFSKLFSYLGFTGTLLTNCTYHKEDKNKFCKAQKMRRKEILGRDQYWCSEICNSFCALPCLFPLRATVTEHCAALGEDKVTRWAFFWILHGGKASRAPDEQGCHFRDVAPASSPWQAEEQPWKLQLRPEFPARTPVPSLCSGDKGCRAGRLRWLQTCLLSVRKLSNEHHIPVLLNHPCAVEKIHQKLQIGTPIPISNLIITYQVTVLHCLHSIQKRSCLHKEAPVF